MGDLTLKEQFREVVHLTLVGISRLSLSSGVEEESTLIHGGQLGLTPEETQEVIAAFLEHHQYVWSRLDWDAVRSAVTRRAMGEEWRP